MFVSQPVDAITGGFRGRGRGRGYGRGRAGGMPARTDAMPRPPRLQQQARPSFTAFLGNLNDGVHEMDLRDALSRFGELLELRIVQSRGFGFASFATEEQLERAIRGLNGQIVAGVVLRITHSRQSQPAGRTGPRPTPGLGFAMESGVPATPAAAQLGYIPDPPVPVEANGRHPGGAVLLADGAGGADGAAGTAAAPPGRAPLSRWRRASDADTDREAEAMSAPGTTTSAGGLISAARDSW